MSINRYNAKRDSSEPLIVSALELAGYDVQRMPKPVDLAVRRPWYPRGLNLLLECKTPRGGKGTLPTDKRQIAQNLFIGRGGAIRVGTPEAALEAMREFEFNQAAHAHP